MKKLTCLGLSLALALGLFTGCGSSNNQDQAAAPAPRATPTTPHRGAQRYREHRRFHLYEGRDGGSHRGV